jgi:hypothetical protein
MTVGMASLLWLQQGCTAKYPPVSAFVAPPATSTPTPGPIFMNFDGISSVPAGWISSNNGGTISVPGLVLSAAQNEDTPCTSGCYSLLAGPIVFSAAGQSANIEYDFASTGVDLTGRTISLYYYLDVLPSNQPYGQMYAQDDATGGYNYQSLGFAGGSFALVAGTWTQASMPATQGGLNPTEIFKIGAQIGTGNGGTVFHTVNFYVDNLAIQ